MFNDSTIPQVYTGGSNVTVSGNVISVSGNFATSDEIAQAEIEIVELQANATVTPLDHDTLISDTMSDTTGYENTVQTGTTTATFSTNKYVNNSGTGTRKESVLTGENDHFGVADTNDLVAQTFTAGSSYTLATVKLLLFVNNSATGTLRCRIFDTSAGAPNTALATIGSVDIATAISGSQSWVSFTGTGTQALTSGTVYAIVIDSANLSTDGVYWKANTSQPLAGGQGYRNATGSWSAQTLDYLFDNYDQASPSTKIIDISLGTITGTVTHTELVCNCPERETGDGVTYKLKNATQSDLSLALNTKNALTNLTTNPTGIEINLTPKSSSPTNNYPSLKSYCLKLWKS